LSRGLVLLLAAAAASAATAETVVTGARIPAPYGAGGSEPWWSLGIEHGRITYDPADGNPIIRVPAARRQPIRNGYRYVTPQLTVDVRHVRCEDDALRAYADTVRVTANRRTYEGCGGAVLPPLSLADTDWVIVSIGGTAVHGDGNSLGFREGRMIGRAGCNEFSGTYRERRPVLTLGRLAVTRMACPGARGTLEWRALRILAGPVRMRFVNGDDLILTGDGGSIRLRP
jgi:heat shock protein HslJ